jgi:ribosomal protein S1
MFRLNEAISLPVWQDFIARHAVGDVLTGQVKRVLPFGAFVEVADGVDGLLHDPDWPTPPEIGSTISVRLDSIDVDNRRVSMVSA